MKTEITGIGWVNSAGAGQGRETLFSVGRAGGLPMLPGKTLFRTQLPRYGRMDQYSRLGISAIALALKDAGLDEWTEKREVGIIASTVTGCLNADADYFDTVISESGRLASPNLFAYTLPNAFLGEAAIHFGLTGAGFAVNEPSLSGVTGLLMAMDSIVREGQGVILAGICDTGSPASLAMTHAVIPGALFLVLRRGPAGTSVSYGELTHDSVGRILFNGEIVDDINSLALMATQGFHTRREDN